DVGVQRPPAVRDSVFAAVGAHAAPGFKVLPCRPASVRCDVPCGSRTARAAHRGHRRAPCGLKTVRYSEKLLEASGIAVEPIDLSEILGRIDRLPDND